MHTKHALWYRPVSRPSADEIDFPVIPCPHPRQMPRDVVGRDGCRLCCDCFCRASGSAGGAGGDAGSCFWYWLSRGSWTAGSRRGGNIADRGEGEAWPPCTAGSRRAGRIGDFSGGEPSPPWTAGSNRSASGGGARRGSEFERGVALPGGVGAARGSCGSGRPAISSPSTDDARSFERPFSLAPAPDDGLLCLSLSTDRAGLVLELVWLGCDECWLRWLYPEWLDDWDTEGEWYGLLMPNSSARLMLGAGPPPSRVCGRIRLFLGGGGREVSRILNEGPRARSLPPRDLGIEASSALRFVDELRIRSCCGLGPGAEGVRAGASSIMLGLGFGKVSERLLNMLMGCGTGGSRSSPPLPFCSCDGGPKPPYPFLRGILGGGIPPPPPFDDAVLGRRILSKGDSGRGSPPALLLLLRGSAFALFAVEGRRFISNGPGAILFIRVKRLGWPFCCGLVPRCADESATSKSPSGSPRPP